MTAPIAAIGGSPTPPAVVAPISATGADPATAAGSASGSLFSGVLDGIQQAQAKSDSLAVQAATGTLNDVHDYLAASTEAGLRVQMTVAIRNKAVEAFNEIMRLQA
ncbi:MULTISPECIES: flagellar hook-basal body complex protein FliE [Actinosynnema]|uniref:Flagellar hook-basal body complex protein FliE n=1 Tax=Actinosynnema pretiosum TaxID=42197 RepID=A0A290Z4L0_9PSEU|nr:flagellar hook-basal body complex protein FliE [Actinosynnema pretiosum]ATE53924.1 flagellar hook-basal body protein FliE [Actinosynnema pretiosum]